MEVSTQLPTQPHLFDRRSTASHYPFGSGSRDYYYPSMQRQPPNAQSYQPERISLPSISDLLNFSRDADRIPPQQPRREAVASPTTPAWHPQRSAYGSQLKVETANIDPRLQRPLSPPMPGSAHPTSAPAMQHSPLLHPPRSPSYARSADAEHAPSYPEYPNDEYHKRLSTASQATPSSAPSASSAQSSPNASKSRLSSFSSSTGASSSAPRPALDQLPAPMHASSPQQRIPHSPVSSTREHGHPYSHPAASHRSAHPYQQPPSHRPALTHQNSSTSVVTATSAGTSRLEDRYVCISCNKAFSRPSSLRIHSFSHTGEKPFRCPHEGCGKAFSVRSNMRRHERGCHIDGAGCRSAADDTMHSPDGLR